MFRTLLFISILICINACNPKQNGILVDDFYSYSSSFEIADSLIWVQNGSLNSRSGIIIKDYQIDSFNVRCFLKYYKDDLYSVTYQVKNKDFEEFKKKYNHVIRRKRKNIEFNLMGGDCFNTISNLDIIEETKSPYCFEWVDLTILNQMN